MAQVEEEDEESDVDEDSGAEESKSGQEQPDSPVKETKVEEEFKQHERATEFVPLDVTSYKKLHDYVIELC